MESKRGRPTAADSVERTARVAAVVTRLLTSDGFDALTFDRVAVEARVAKRTLYRDYVDRGGLVRAAVRRLHDAAQTSGPGDPTRTPQPLREYATTLVTTLLSDEAIGVHRAVIAAATRYPEVAAAFYAEGPQRSIEELTALLKSMPNEPSGSSNHPARPTAELLFAALTGEAHRRRLLGLDEAPDDPAIARHAEGVLAALNLA
ncbi:TetR/AcrR family transcriptional regulator C-terminal domain-containing protein [Leucobacter musarum]|uniref:TetR/AcrR family transcriptional regulator C-terminal domain-containing protein n=1 Tax=Leucobacter musarum TaxID=1930747 RepID=UPI0006A7B942|nr:TetR/AcrR family transcriptional regulator C-terminal domain-containing protein [Leucobacter musarum]